MSRVINHFKEMTLGQWVCVLAVWAILQYSIPDVWALEVCWLIFVGLCIYFFGLPRAVLISCLAFFFICWVEFSQFETQFETQYEITSFQSSENPQQLPSMLFERVGKCKGTVAAETILRAAFNVAKSDSVLDQKEREVLQKIGASLGFSTAQTSQLLGF